MNSIGKCVTESILCHAKIFSIIIILGLICVSRDVWKGHALFLFAKQCAIHLLVFDLSTWFVLLFFLPVRSDIVWLENSFAHFVRLPRSLFFHHIISLSFSSRLFPFLFYYCDFSLFDRTHHEILRSVFQCIESTRDRENRWVFVHFFLSIFRAHTYRKKAAAAALAAKSKVEFGCSCIHQMKYMDFTTIYAQAHI